MLPETAAWALLKQHCGPLHDADWIGRGYLRGVDWADAAYEQVDFIAQPVASDHYTPRSVGAHLRLALGVAHAVSCCRGYEPASQQRFWRRMVETLWRGDRGVTIIPDDSASTRSTFAHVGVDWRAETTTDEAFWEGFFHGDAACRATLATVLNDLRPHFAPASPPPLWVVLSRCSVGECSSSERFDAAQADSITSPAALHTILRAALTAPARAWPVGINVALVVEYRIDDDAATTRGSLRLLRRACRPKYPSLHFVVDRLTIQLAPRGEPPAGVKNRQFFVASARALGELLCSVILGADKRLAAPDVRAVALLGCSAGSDIRHVGQVLSVVALASWSVSELRCDGLLDATGGDKPLRLAWLAFALYYRRRTPLALSLRVHGIAISQQDCEYIEQLMAEGTPLRDVVEDALRRRSEDEDHKAFPHVEWLPLGTTVRLACNTRLYFEPMRESADCEAVTLWTAQEAELVVYVVAGGRGFVGVVSAAYGLVWTAASYVLPWRPDGDANDLVMADEEDIALSSLAINFTDAGTLVPLAHRVSALLAWLVCETVTSLSIDRAVITRDDLALVLKYCPLLASLVLDRCVVESVGPLIDAYATQEDIKLSELSLLGVRDLRLRDTIFGPAASGRDCLRTVDAADGDAPTWIPELVDTLTSGLVRGVLHKFYFDCRAMASASDEREMIEQLAQAIADGTLTLTRLHVTCRWQVLDTCCAELGRLRDAVLADPPTVRPAVLSVLRTFGCGARDVARRVLALVEGEVVRTITWDSDVNV